MKKVVVVGGRLQGLETLYLAAKAQIYTTLVDKDPAPIGQNFCNRFIHQDVIQYDRDLLTLLKEADFVIPALENDKALQVLVDLQRSQGINLIHSPEAYAISSSKLRSDVVMASHNIPVPCHYPQGKLPYIAKPSSLSGSEGVIKLTDESQLRNFLSTHSDDAWVVEEYLDGPSYSIEVIGYPGNYRAYHITELFMDSSYDCKRVLSCPDLSPALRRQFCELALSLGEMVGLYGIMDVEVIEQNGILKVLEIDVRHPSQTPINIYHATGQNFMAELHRIFCPQSDFTAPPLEPTAAYVSLEQVEVGGGYIRILGEHILSQAKGLRLIENFCGSVEALTNYEPGKETWVATLICKSGTRQGLSRQRETMFKKIGELSGNNLEILDLDPMTN